MVEGEEVDFLSMSLAYIAEVAKSVDESEAQMNLFLLVEACLE